MYIIKNMTVPNDVVELFEHMRTYPWHDDTSDEVVFAQAARAARDIIAGDNYTCKKIFYRLGGQSGSGKTTQLLPVIGEFEASRGNKPIIIGVRTFAPYHPNYDEIVKTHPAGKVREVTNGFAFKCLMAAVKIILERGVMLVLDVTIHAPRLEEYVRKNVSDNGYSANYHIFAVAKEVSNAFIEKRKVGTQDTMDKEKGKVVLKSSIDFWYDILPKGVEYLADSDMRSQVIIWTAFDLLPLYYGKFDGAQKALQRGRARVEELKYSEDQLRQAKLEWFLKT